MRTRMTTLLVVISLLLGSLAALTNAANAAPATSYNFRGCEPLGDGLEVCYVDQGVIQFTDSGSGVTKSTTHYTLIVEYYYNGELVQSDYGRGHTTQVLRDGQIQVLNFQTKGGGTYGDYACTYTSSNVLVNGEVRRQEYDFQCSGG